MRLLSNDKWWKKWYFCPSHWIWRLEKHSWIFIYIKRWWYNKAYKSLKVKSKDFSFCVELPIKAKLKKYKLATLPTHERVRIAGKKKVNEFKDGFLILISILRLLILKLWEKKLL